MIAMTIGAVAVMHRSFAYALTHLAASLLYLHSFIFGRPNDINAVTWSLEVEVQFYLLAPVLMSVLRIRPRLARRAVLVGAAAMSILASSFVTHGRPTLWLGYYLHYFLCGILLADVYFADWGERPSTSGRWDIVSVVSWPLLATVWRDAHLTKVFFVPLLYLVMHSALRGRRTSQLLRTGWIPVIGGMCYSIYLIHYPLISQVGRVASTVAPSGASFSTRLLLYTGQMVPVILGVSGVYFALIERPCMNWRPKLPAESAD
jgi:peptidoglycan/LPS O-acetylase OafA/YrhL